MPVPRPRYDKYGRPLPTLAEPRSQDTAARAANSVQREQIVQRLTDILDEHYPHLLREDVNAEVTIAFKVVGGTMQQDIYISIVRQYRQEP